MPRGPRIRTTTRTGEPVAPTPTPTPRPTVSIRHRGRAYVPPIPPTPTPTEAAPKAEPSWKKETVAGQIYTGELGLGLREKMVPMSDVLRGPEYERTKAQRELTAGAVGIPESWVRPDIPTPAGALVGTVLGRPEQLEAYTTGEVSLAYLLGGLGGTYVEAKAFGYGLSKAWGGLRKAGYTIGKTRYGRPVYEAYKFGRVARVAHKARVGLQRYVPEYFKKGVLTRGEVSPPVIPKGTPIGLEHLTAIRAGWALEVAPRTSGVTIGKSFITEGMKPPMRHLFYTGGKVSVGYLRDLSYVSPARRQEALLPYVTQTQVTRMGIIPHVPRTVTHAGRGLVSQIIVGTGTATLLKGLRRPQRLKRGEKAEAVPVDETLARTRERLRQVALLEEREKQKGRMVPVLKTPSMLVQAQVPSTEQVITQKSVLVPKTPFPPQIFETSPIKWFPRWEENGRRGRRGVDRRSVAWYFKRHPVMSASEAARHILGKPRERKPRKPRKREAFSMASYLLGKPEKKRKVERTKKKRKSQKRRRRKR